MKAPILIVLAAVLSACETLPLASNSSAPSNLYSVHRTRAQEAELEAEQGRFTERRHLQQNMDFAARRPAYDRYGNQIGYRIHNSESDLDYNVDESGNTLPPWQQ